MIYGKYGWYDELESGRYVVCFTNHKLLNKHFPVTDYEYATGAECAVYLSRAEFNARKIPRMLQVNLSKQDELRDLHDHKYRGPRKPS